MKKGIYFTLSYKGLLWGIIAGCLTVSFVVFLAEPQTGKTTSKIYPVAFEKQLIIIDAGHGGEDGGTASSKGTNEKSINLEISAKLQSVFNLCGYRTLMTRTNDELIYDASSSTMREKKVSDLRNRLSIAENNPDSIFLSVHQNYFTQSKYWGTQVFYSGNNSESALIAESIQNSAKEKLQNDNTRKIKKSGKEIFLLNNIKSPAVMVECGFMSNPSEALKLEDSAYQTKMAISIVEGINNYLNAKGEF